MTVKTPRTVRARRTPFIVLALMLTVLALTACARIRAPEGGSGGLVHGNVFFTGTAEGQVVALDKVTGEAIWRFDLRGDPSAGERRGHTHPMTRPLSITGLQVVLD